MRQQRLNFFPLPQGQGLFLPTLPVVLWNGVNFSLSTILMFSAGTPAAMAAALLG
jgi:hypothetical protein